MSESTTFPERVRSCAGALAEIGVTSLGALHDLTARRLVRYAITITRNQHDAEDVVQTVLVGVAGRPKLLAGAKCPWSYLLQMVRNESLGILRRKKRYSLVGNLTDLLTRRKVDEIELEDTHRAVWQALRLLPTKQAEVVVLKIWEEMSFARISEILEISPNTAASRYQYAMNKLAQKLAPLQSEMCDD